MKGFALNTVLWPTVPVVLVVLVQGEVRRFFTQHYLCAPGDVEQGCATPPVICERMWAGGTARRLRGPLAADSPPDWANSVGMRGCVCHGMLPQPHCMDTGLFIPPRLSPPPLPPPPPTGIRRWCPKGKSPGERLQGDP